MKVGDLKKFSLYFFAALFGIVVLFSMSNMTNSTITGNAINEINNPNNPACSESSFDYAFVEVASTGKNELYFGKGGNGWTYDLSDQSWKKFPLSSLCSEASNDPFCLDDLGTNNIDYLLVKDLNADSYNDVLVGIGSKIYFKDSKTNSWTVNELSTYCSDNTEKDPFCNVTVQQNGLDFYAILDDNTFVVGLNQTAWVRMGDSSTWMIKSLSEFCSNEPGDPFCNSQFTSGKIDYYVVNGDISYIGQGDKIYTFNSGATSNKWDVTAFSEQCDKVTVVDLIADTSSACYWPPTINNDASLASYNSFKGKSYSNQLMNITNPQGISGIDKRMLCYNGRIYSLDDIESPQWNYLNTPRGFVQLGKNLDAIQSYQFTTTNNDDFKVMGYIANSPNEGIGTGMSQNPSDVTFPRQVYSVSGQDEVNIYLNNYSIDSIEFNSNPSINITINGISYTKLANGIYDLPNGSKLQVSGISLGTTSNSLSVVNVAFYHHKEIPKYIIGDWISYANFSLSPFDSRFVSWIQVTPEEVPNTCTIWPPFSNPTPNNNLINISNAGTFSIDNKGLCYNGRIYMLEEADYSNSYRSKNNGYFFFDLVNYYSDQSDILSLPTIRLGDWVTHFERNSTDPSRRVFKWCSVNDPSCFSCYADADCGAGSTCIGGTCSSIVNQLATCNPASEGGPRIAAGTRLNVSGALSYCDPSTLNYIPTKGLNQTCIASYECDSNTCFDGRCVSVTGELKRQARLLTKILCALGNPIDFIQSGNEGQSASNNDYIECLED